MSNVNQLKKLQDLQKKKQEEVKATQQEIEKIQKQTQELSIHLLEKAGVFDLPFEVLLGGILEVIQTVQKSPQKREELQKAGANFLQKRSGK